MESLAESFMKVLQQDFADAWQTTELLRMLLRLCVAVLIGGIIGYQRERVGKSAGMRTHMLVTAGTAFFVMAPQMEGMPLNDLSRVLQGIITGIGFLGGGVILKLNEDKEIRGLTTAAGIWFVAALGIAVGFGKLTSALIATALAFAILEVVFWFENGARRKSGHTIGPGNEKA